jgi:hypothetical protein
MIQTENAIQDKFSPRNDNHCSQENWACLYARHLMYIHILFFLEIDQLHAIGSYKCEEERIKVSTYT